MPTDPGAERGDPRAGGWPPTEQAVAAARDGDTSRLGEILSTGFPRLVGFYRGMGLRNAEAEDLASEALEGMVRNIGRLREPAAFEGWFWTIARNRLRSTLRKKGRVEREADYPPIDDPADVAIAHFEHDVIRSALAQLPERDRMILWLREVEELSYAEIGTRITMATGAVRVAALRARRRLEAIYAELHPEDV